jgi:hypothetical protein
MITLSIRIVFLAIIDQAPNTASAKPRRANILFFSSTMSRLNQLAKNKFRQPKYNNMQDKGHTHNNCCHKYLETSHLTIPPFINSATNTDKMYTEAYRKEFRDRLNSSI